MGKIYVTGDIHGNPERLQSGTFRDGKKLTKSDIVEILGDFGLVWDYEGENETEKERLDWLDNQPWTTVATLGNHENYDRIAQLPVEEHFGAPTYVLRPSVFLLQSGYVYDFDGVKVWNFNGARSHDISDGILDPEDPDFKYRLLELRMNFKQMWRIKNWSWWEQEIEQNPEVYERGLQSLADNDWSVDYIWTHCAPVSTVALLGFHEDDPLVKYFEKIKYKAKFKEWYFGHYHQNLCPEPKMNCLYGLIKRIV